MRVALLKINRWGIYQAWRMHNVKQAWYRLLENKERREREEEESPAPKASTSKPLPAKKAEDSEDDDGSKLYQNTASP